MKKIKVIPLVAAACVAALCGCPSASSGGDDDGIPDLAVSADGKAYIAGYSTGAALRAYYWADGTLNTISGAFLGTASKAADVVPTNLGVYVVGARSDSVGGELVERAIVWFQGDGEYLETYPSFAYAAALHEGKVLVAGWYEDEAAASRPCWWEVADAWSLSDGGYAVASRSIVRHDLPSEAGGWARDIISEGDDVYICGRYYDGGYKACLWTNGVRTDLPGGTFAETVRRIDGKLYVGGASASAARYWIDGTGSDVTGLPAGSVDCGVSGIAKGSDGPILGGFYYKTHDYGFSVVSDTMTASLPRVIGAAAAGSDVYIGFVDGWLKNDDYTDLPWIDGYAPVGIRFRLY